PPPIPPRSERPAAAAPTNSIRPQGSTVVPKPMPVPREPEPQPLPVPTPRPQAQPQRKPGTNRESPLLENDVDALLGMQKPGKKFELDDDSTPRKQPVSGLDALSLMDEPRGLHLSPQKATLLAVAV